MCSATYYTIMTNSCPQAALEAHFGVVEVGELGHGGLEALLQQCAQHEAEQRCCGRVSTCGASIGCTPLAHIVALAAAVAGTLLLRLDDSVSIIYYKYDGGPTLCGTVG
jgi:hypothetical protein